MVESCAGIMRFCDRGLRNCRCFSFFFYPNRKRVMHVRIEKFAILCRVRAAINSPTSLKFVEMKIYLDRNVRVPTNDTPLHAYIQDVPQVATLIRKTDPSRVRNRSLRRTLEGIVIPQAQDFTI